MAIENVDTESAAGYAPPSQAETWVYFDALGMMQQLGAIPQMGQAGTQPFSCGSATKTTPA